MSAINKWIWVTTGGMSGLLLGGVGAMYAPEAIAKIKTKNDDDNQAPSIEDNEVAQQETELQVADVSDDMTFSEAFAEAREDVGAGGVFYWHGGIYSTFYKEEWDNMTPEEKHEFGELANDMFPVPENLEGAVRPWPVNDITEDSDTIGANRELGEHHTGKVDETEPKTDLKEEGAQEPGETVEVEPKVIDYDTIDGHLAMTVDVDGDDQADYLIVDADDSNTITPDDLVIDKEYNVGTVAGEYLGNLNERAKEDMTSHTGTDNSDDALAIVGYGEYEGHLVTGYDSKGDGKTDIVIIDVDGDGMPSTGDVMVNDEGQTTYINVVEEEEAALEDDIHDNVEEEETTLEDDIDDGDSIDNMDSMVSL